MIRAIVTDIEGTTSSISFVKDVLFPYARRALPRFVATRGKEPAVRKWLDAVATELGIPHEFEAVTSAHADFSADTPLVRFWLFAMQAYGYVLLRLGEEALGAAVLEKVTLLDRADNTKTRTLLQVIARRGRDDD